MPTRAVLLAIFSVSCAAMVLSVAVPVVIVPNSFDDSLFDRPCNHQPCNSVAEGRHRMPLRYPALSEICRNAQLAGTWVFDLNGSHLSLILRGSTVVRTGWTPSLRSRRVLRRRAEAKPEPSLMRRKILIPGRIGVFSSYPVFLGPTRPAPVR